MTIITDDPVRAGENQEALEGQTILELRKIRKTFPGVLALDDVDFDLRCGETHCLVGENGAGKSTLMKIISGAHPKSSGEIRLKGRRIKIRSPRHAQALGISIIYQELNLVPHLTVGENVYLGREDRVAPGVIDQKKIHERAGRMLERLGVRIDPRRRVGGLGVAEMQMVEIAKAMSFEASVLIMDEPTSALSDTEIDELFATMARLKARGVAIIYISHRLEEIYEIGDRVTVMRDGRIVATHEVRAVSASRLILDMVDREVTEHYPERNVKIGGEVLRTEDLRGGERVRGVTFSIRSGEVVGLAGLLGSGRTELARAIFGADPILGGRVFLQGREITSHTPRAAIGAGMGFLTEDRKSQGLVLQLSVKDNTTLANLKAVTSCGVLDLKKERAIAARAIETLRIKTPSLNQPVVNLSGGNQQKVVLSKWLGMDARLLIFDEPTRGIDVGAKIEIYQIMNKLAARGVAILMISSDLLEVLGMSDRILVMHHGRIAGELTRGEATQEKILALAIGED